MVRNGLQWRSVSAVRLVARFFSSLWCCGPQETDAAWAAEHLLSAERDLWDSMSKADRRHSVAVAWKVTSALGSQATRPGCGRRTSA